MGIQRVKLTVTGVALMVVCSAAARGDNWPNWRGPAASGVVADGSYPTSWSNEDNVLWKVSMPSHAGSTPVVWGDKILLTVAASEKNLVRCYDRAGKLIWETAVGAERPGKHKKASGCNPSPITDGQHVFVYFKSGDLAGLDLNGKLLWHKNLQKEYGEDTLWWDLGTSPVLTRDHVVVAVVQSGPSYLAAFDKSTGDVVWKVDRQMDAPEEANQTYSTPLVIDRDGAQMIVVLGADYVTGHEALTGKELWRVGSLNPERNGYFRSIASAVYSDDVIVAPYARGKTLTAISLAGKVLWQIEDISSDVPTPAAADGRVYVCGDKGQLTCLDIQSGKTIWSASTGKNRNAFSASPIVASGRVYVAREDGTVFVFNASDGTEVATNEMNEFTIATPVFVDGNILIRTSDNLYCIGKSS
jgi:outer membrane protein assembly factor BamB